MLLEVITFDPTVVILISLVLRKLNIYRFPETPRSSQSESKKTSKCVSEVKTEKVQQVEFTDVTMTLARQPYKVHEPQKACQRLKIAPSTSNWARIEILGFWEHFWAFYFSLFSPYFSPKKQKKHIKVS